MSGGGTMGDTRAALIEAAIAVLHESGFARASARRIAQRAGCNQALVFYHFGSVNDLLVAALEEVSARRMAAYRELLARARGGSRSGPGAIRRWSSTTSARLTTCWWPRSRRSARGGWRRTVNCSSGD